MPCACLRDRHLPREELVTRKGTALTRAYPSQPDTIFRQTKALPLNGTPLPFRTLPPVAAFSLTRTLACHTQLGHTHHKDTSHQLELPPSQGLPNTHTRAPFPIKQHNFPAGCISGCPPSSKSDEIIVCLGLEIRGQIKPWVVLHPASLPKSLFRMKKYSRPYFSRASHSKTASGCLKPQMALC